jgi:hypothetical protein
VAGGVGITGLVIYVIFNYLTNGQVEISVEELESLTAPQEERMTTEDFEGADDYEVFASTVLGSNNDMWSQKFDQENRVYNPPKLVLFREATESACGVATSQIGPHYCSSNKTIYLDETFFDELTNRYGAAGGDVAEAYVISHEVGHHAQNELGIMDELGYGSSNEINIKLELQADCFAGLWANSIKDLGVLTPGEISEAMDAAAAVGDDRIQEKVTGRISPENWTHGSSEQRVLWFTKGYDSGSLSSCDTFN